MNFDRNSLTKLLALPDEEFKKVLFEIAREAGVDTSNFSVSDGDIARLKGILSLASDKEISQFLQNFGGKNTNGK